MEGDIRNSCTCLSLEEAGVQPWLCLPQDCCPQAKGGTGSFLWLWRLGRQMQGTWLAHPSVQAMPKSLETLQQAHWPFAKPKARPLFLPLQLSLPRICLGGPQMAVK